ncbi:MAG: MFS transporter [Woeseiaceae bacterium]|nr:MFS transporter [Woeseiaceae bacterium]
MKQKANVLSSNNWRFYFQEKIITLFFLGFSAGLPFPLVYSTLTGWLEEADIERSTISTFAWLGFAYSFKFLWSPLVDSLKIPVLSNWLGRRRAWLLVSQLGIACSLFLLSGIDPGYALKMFTFVAIAVALLSATQDIALDAYRIEIAEIEMQGLLAAAYQYGYRVAIAVGTAGAFLIAEYGSWSISYKAMSLCMLVGIGTTLYCNEPEDKRYDRKLIQGKREQFKQWILLAVVNPFTDFFKRYGSQAIILLLFISFFRVSDYVLGILASPFYLDIGFSKTQIAGVAKFYGLWVSLIGTAFGATAILKFGVSKCIVVATILIASTNLFFALMAYTGPYMSLLTITISADNFTMGFAGTVFLSYLSSLTNLSFTATQYALFTSVSTFLGKFAAGFSGNIQESIGWVGFFLYAALMGVPAIILSLFVAKKIQTVEAHQKR